MIRRYLIFSLIVISPLLVVVVVNECFSVPDRTHKYVEDYCTWYCHDVTCPHWKDDYKKHPTAIKKIHKNIFTWYVQSLHNNSLGLNYGAINLLVFIIFYPVLGGALVWNLIRKLK